MCIRRTYLRHISRWWDGESLSVDIEGDLRHALDISTVHSCL